ncbi:hypothetical protein B277_11250 [Janibacter hoylei PVAS-1]|uniref:Uncharacterized protein n=2 Tax=Janibacter TaxID=53457 RepID=K1E184_9MICO|nr:DUF6011 domain-containing protein [Janibacter hoylei]EKA60751.1 hypothetical protein B277_11250 [Janibacter hoylei PVAS-1]RWU85463.1 hypothetical protein CWN80_00240 [Janibacter hoylei PVAS-1]
MHATSFRGTLAHDATPELLELLGRRGVPAKRLAAHLTEDEELDLLAAHPPKGVKPRPEVAPPAPLSARPVATRLALEDHLDVDRRRDPVEEVHLVDGTVARIRRTADGERYAERWDETSRRYGPHEPGLVERTTEATRLDAVGASHHGRTWGHCMVCGRLLTNATSVRAGIGPVCVVNVYGHDARTEIGGEDV